MQLPDIARFIPVLAVLVACGGDGNGTGPDDSLPDAQPASMVTARDVANAGNASDMEVEFDPPGDMSGIAAFRILVAPSATSLNLSQAGAAPAASYASVAPGDADAPLTLPAGMLDVDGDPIAQDESYRAYVLSVADGVDAGENALSSPSNTITLRQPSAAGVAGLILDDVANTGNPTDFEVGFVPVGDESTIGEYRAILVKSSNAGAFTLQDASSLPGGRYVSAAPQGQALAVRMTNNSADADGDPLTAGETYVAFVLSVADGTQAAANTLTGPSNSISLSVTDLVATLTGEINASGGVVVGPDGAIYVADFGSLLGNATGNTVYRVTPDGTVEVFASGFQGASGNAFDSQGNLFQSSIAGGFVSMITPAGDVSTFATGLQGPVGITIAPGDTLYVSECAGNQISKITPGGTVTTFATSNLFSCPNGITRDDQGNVYPVNFNNGLVLKVAPDGTVTSLATIPGGNNGHVTFGNGVLYVVGRGANQIFEVDLSGNVELLAGAGPRGKRDGSAPLSEWSIPNGISINATGDTLFINDAVPITGSALNPVVLRAVVLE